MKDPIKSKSLILLGLVVVILIPISFRVLNRHDIVIKDDEWYSLNTIHDVSLFAQNSEDQFTFSLMVKNAGLLAGYVTGDKLEVVFETEEDENIITIYDENGDGVPEYRLISSKTTDVVKKEYLTHSRWAAEREEVIP